MMFEAARTVVSAEENLRPNLAILFSGGVAVAILSFLWLPVTPATASVLLGLLMIAGAQVDARTYLLPNAVTWGAIVSGILPRPH